MNTFKYYEHKVGISVNDNKQHVDEDIIKMEKELDLTLPSDYKKFLKKYNGGILNEVLFMPANWEYGIFVEDLFDVKKLEVKTKQKLSEQESEFGEILKPVKKFLHIGWSAGSYSLLISCEEDDYGIVYIQDDRNRDEFSVEEIASNFKEVILGMYPFEKSTPEQSMEKAKKWTVKKNLSAEEQEEHLLGVREIIEERLEDDYIELKID